MINQSNADPDRWREDAWADPDGRPLPFFAGTWPRTNVIDSDTSVIVTAEIPGLRREAVELTVHANVLTMSGERELEVPVGYAVQRQERSLVKFARRIELPCDVGECQMSASVDDGVLTVTLPKAADDIQVPSHPPRVEQWTNGPAIAPPIDVLENDRELLLRADVPGATQESVVVACDERRQLSLWAKARISPAGTPYSKEYQAQTWCRRYTLPQDADRDAASIALADGVLTIRIPKRAPAKLIPLRVDRRVALGVTPRRRRPTRMRAGS